MHVSKSTPGRTSGSAPRRTQAERRARTRAALLEAAARGISRYGYGNLVLEQVASEAGYTRGALYHLFAGKEQLALEAVEWVARTWEDEVGRPAEREPDPVAALIAFARGHIVFCRRDIARVMMALRVEFAGREHPVGRAVEQVDSVAGRRLTALIKAGRRDGSIPAGPPAVTLALAATGAIEGLAIQFAGARPHDERIAERVIRGVLGLPANGER
jgi:AcrR family transcriptional regulator